MYGDEKKITVNIRKDELLQKLRLNRERHLKIVLEAKEGYIKKAKEALLKKLKHLKQGLSISLRFDLIPPTSHLSEYDTVIGMLEMSHDIDIELTSELYRQYVEDKWNWRHEFLQTSACYSGTSRALVGDSFDLQDWGVEDD